MKLTSAEQLILHNQYEILSKVDPRNKSQYELLLKCLYNGYYEDFEALAPHFESNLDPVVRTQVIQILEMFRSLTPSNGSGIKPFVVFAGFDGNEETEHYAYARFLLTDRGLWAESLSNDLNTHTPVLEDYLSMLEIWEAAADKNNLQQAEVDAILAKAPYKSKQIN